MPEDKHVLDPEQQAEEVRKRKEEERKRKKQMSGAVSAAETGQMDQDLPAGDSDDSGES